MLLTRPVDIEFEIFVFKTYLRLIEHLNKVWVERDTKLEDDIPLYEAAADWRVKMVIRYRIERKKIFRSQLAVLADMVNLLEFIAKEKPSSI